MTHPMDQALLKIIMYSLLWECIEFRLVFTHSSSTVTNRKWLESWSSLYLVCVCNCGASCTGQLGICLQLGTPASNCFATIQAAVSKIAISTLADLAITMGILNPFWPGFLLNGVCWADQSSLVHFKLLDELTDLFGYECVLLTWWFPCLSLHYMNSSPVNWSTLYLHDAFLCATQHGHFHGFRHVEIMSYTQSHK